MACHSSLLGSGLAKDMDVLGDDSRSFELSSFILGHFLLLGMSLGLSIKRAEIVKFLSPTPFYYFI